MAKRIKQPKQPQDLLGQVDVVFVIDTTGSMAAYIDEARRQAREQADRIAAEGNLDLRFAVVEYRDHPPQDHTFAARVHGFGDGDALQSALIQLSAGGGGDMPESVWDGLQAAGNLDFREHADRLCFLIGDSPPHGYDCLGDHWPQGCPCGLTAAAIIEQFKARRIQIHAHSIAGVPETYRAFSEVAEGTGGSCTQVEAPQASTHAYAGTLMSTSGAIADSRNFIAASTAMAGASVNDVAAALGWSKERAAATASYLNARGIKIEEDPKS